VDTKASEEHADSIFRIELGYRGITIHINREDQNLKLNTKWGKPQAQIISQDVSRDLF
jgi:hypothetical protein